MEKINLFLVHLLGCIFPKHQSVGSHVLICRGLLYGVSILCVILLLRVKQLEIVQYNLCRGSHFYNKISVRNMKLKLSVCVCGNNINTKIRNKGLSQQGMVMEARPM